MARAKPAVPAERIAQAILVVRGHRVMLDADLASLYAVPTKALLQAVRRNAERFPDDFMFQVEGEEWEALRSQFVTSNAGRGGRGRSCACARCSPPTRTSPASSPRSKRASTSASPIRTTRSRDPPGHPQTHGAGGGATEAEDRVRVDRDEKSAARSSSLVLPHVAGVRLASDVGYRGAIPNSAKRLFDRTCPCAAALRSQ